MQLQHVIIEGFRRFEESQTVQIQTKLTAIVGPNEAGKTSFLNALEYMGHDGPIDDRDCSSMSSATTRIEMAYFLSKEECSAASIKIHSWLFAVKKKDGIIRYRVYPLPQRNRDSLLKIIKIVKTKKYE